MSPLKVGIVGLGWVSTAHANAFLENPETEIAAVCSRRQWDKKELAKIYGESAKLYNNYEDFLNDPEIEAVDICTPHFVHPEQTIAAAKKGKHLMIEKPLALNLKDLDAMKRAVNDAKVKSTVYFELRFIPHLNFVRSAIEQGLVGTPHHLEVDYYHGIGPWIRQYEWHVKKEYGGSALLTAGIHALDALLYFKKSEVEEVYAYSTKTEAEVFKEYEYDPISMAILQFKDGSIGKCVSCVAARQPYLFNVYVLGSHGTIWNNKIWSDKYEGIDADKWVDVPTAKADSGEVLAHPYGPQVAEFVQCVKEGKDSTVDFNEAYKTHKVAFAIEESLKQKKPVKLADID
ncbi:MAG: Gfo/Idh/MocA family oxidoreductase [Spirochaetales bacterium]|nr:Gfo/Idh/MocA family oxidoreductase [Spirochaetales bacterium]MCF7938425.1 Gfo/Idh/MocA family oxidoreductase [Spirochaetales bacterium]